MRTRLFTLFTLAVVSLLISGCGSSRDSDGATTVAATPEAIARATSFVGADRCGGCHETMHDGWAATGHTMKLRDGSLEVNFINDGNTNGRSDFFGADEFNLETEASSSAAFGGFGTSAPILGSDFGGAYIKLGASKYYVNYTLGGNGVDTNNDGLVLNNEAKWKQRYITKIGLSNYILPVQFNAKTQLYTTYDTSKWYDDDNALIAGTVPPTKNNSYERRCAGCHVTGLQVALVGDEWTMDFADISVSCEACHGPGGQHAESPKKENIVNPATMTTTNDLNGDGTVDQLDNLTARNYICYPCHSRGAGKHTEGGTTLAYSSKTGADGKAELYLPGLDWKEYYDISEKDSDYYGGTPSSDDFIASKSHHQQQQDLDYGPHAPDKSYDHECFVCHDMHDATNDSMVVTELVEDGITVPIDTSNTIYENDSSALCLTCHAGFGDFTSLTVGDVRNNPSAISAAIADHAGEMAVMGHSEANCTDCHMPKTAKSAGTFADADGNVIRGDVASHTLRIIWPSLSVQYPGLPNSCSNCHNADTSAPDGTDEILAWANSGHGDETAEAWKHYDWDEGDEATTPGSRQSCQRCHTATGAKNYLSDPDNYDQTDNEFFLGKGKNQVLYCYGCHSGTGTDLHTPGAITADYTDAPTEYPDASTSNVCLACHTGRESGDSIKNSTADFADKRFINSHYLTAGGTVFALSGYHFGTRDYSIPVGDTHDDIGQGTTGNAAVDAGFTAGPCATCHFSSDDGSHTQSPFTQYAVDDLSLNPVCVNCHASRGPGTDAANAWFGHEVTLADLVADVVAPHKGRYLAALEVLKVQLGLKGFDFTAGYPYFANRDWVTTADSTGKLNMGAAFNYNMLIHDPGGVAHNRRYTRRLIYDAIDHLDDGVLNYSVSATLNALDVATTYKASAISYLLQAQLGTAGDRF